MSNPSFSSGAMLYEQVAGNVERLIEEGVLRTGERVPSVRKLSRQQRVSLSTAFQAYFLLESKGLIEARPRSGFYVKLPARNLPPEPMLSKPSLAATHVKVDELVSEVFAAARQRDVIPFGAACPSTALVPPAKLNRMLIDVIRRSTKFGVDYDFPPGHLPLRRELAKRSLEWGGSLSADELVTTCGCMEALNLCLRAVAAAGDTIAIESPTYFGILQVIESLGMKALEIPTSPRTGICLDAMERALKQTKIKAVLVTANFNNPLGSLMPDDHKQQLVAMLARRDIPLIEDDLYGDLYFGTTRPKTLKAFDKKELVLLCSSFSKSLAPGYRVGWAAAGRFTKQVERLKTMTTLCTPTFPQIALADFLHTGGYDRHLRGLRTAFATQVQRTMQAVCEYFPKGSKVTRPAGGFVLWVELPKKTQSLKLFRMAQAEKISITPGPVFSAKMAYTNFIRISCGHPWSEKLERGLETLGSLANRA